MVGPRPVAIRKFQRELLSWFDSHARDLPWRRTADPYHIWISEIMLQQTRVTAVLEYYSRFLALFPTITALAQAKEPAVLAAWSGLGYYRRAKMMHRAAQVVVEAHQGALPTTAAELRKLPGIGEYTSSAIASIAFNERVAVVDGNVERVLLRVFPGDEKPATPAAQDRSRSGKVDLKRPRVEYFVHATCDGKVALAGRRRGGDERGDPGRAGQRAAGGPSVGGDPGGQRPAR